MKKNIKFSVVLLTILTPCISFGCENKKQHTIAENHLLALKQDSIFSVMQYEICDSILPRTQITKPTVSILAECYNASIRLHAFELKNLGIDTGSESGKLKLTNYVLYKIEGTCPDIYNLVAADYAKKLFFSGALISQTKLSTGCYQILIKNDKTSEIRTFLRDDSIPASEYLSRQQLGVEYEIVKNKKTNKKEFVLQKNGMITSVGTVEAKTKK